MKKKALFGALFLFCSFSVFGQMCEIPRDKDGKILRHKNEIEHFKQHNVCPGTGKVEKVCKDYVVDHLQPLCACGQDKETNMQWQGYKESKIKDKIEVNYCNCISGKNPNCKAAPLAK
jgi:hypothetical protein